MPARTLLIGVDFDNTIVCYDPLFHQLGVQRGWIPAESRADKNSIRNYLRAQDREDDWTLLQGIAYGSRIEQAEPFPGVEAFFEQCRSRQVPVHIISHKTRQPYRGPQCDLHAAARGWLRSHGFLGDRGSILREEHVFLEETRQEKLARIVASGCTHFIDDLPEFLLDAEFPGDVVRILFDPADRYAEMPGLLRFTSWQAVRNHFFLSDSFDCTRERTELG